MEVTGLRRRMGGIPERNTGSNGRVIILNDNQGAERDPLVAGVLEEAAGVELSQNLNAKSRAATQRVRRVNSLLAETHLAEDAMTNLDQDLRDLTFSDPESAETKRQALNQKAQQIYSQHASLLARNPFAGGGARPFLTEVSPRAIDASRDTLAKDRELLAKRRGKLVEMSQNTPTIRETGDLTLPLREFKDAASSAESVYAAILSSGEEALSAQANVDPGQANQML